MLTDCHVHFDRIPAERIPRVVQHARDFGVGRIILVSKCVSTSRQTLEFARQYEGIYAGIGIHPIMAHEAAEGDYDKLRELAATSNKIVCLGEIGLDYGEEYGAGQVARNKPPAPPEVQKKVFRRQIRLARDLKLPVNVHVRRSSSRDVLDILREENAGEVGGILHQFMANEAVAGEMFDLGMHIGISQFICDPRADRLRGVVKNLPLEKMVLETDTPAQYPPETDIPGEPMHTRLVAEKLAEIRGLALTEIEAITSANVTRVFGI